MSILALRPFIRSSIAARSLGVSLGMADPPLYSGKGGARSDVKDPLFHTTTAIIAAWPAQGQKWPHCKGFLAKSEGLAVDLGISYLEDSRNWLVECSF
jgi:hypothetical protein